MREACLVVLHGESIGRRIPLPGATTLLVGRSLQSDVQFSEESVSRHHARIEPLPRPGTLDGWQVVDLGSTNGTLVNDRPVKSAELHHGDQIQVGRNYLKFLDSGHVESAYHEEIYRLVTTDGLTNLANRRAFEEALAREFSRSTRYTRPLSVVIFDIDHFKKLNDTYGHLAGDAALRQLANILRGNIRRDDLASRMGGEEFALLLPEIDHPGSLVAAEKLRRLVDEHGFEYDGAAMPLTLSAGAATRQPTDHDATDLLRRADERLYDAKRAGRNRVRA